MKMVRGGELKSSPLLLWDIGRGMGISFGEILGNYALTFLKLIDT